MLEKSGRGRAKATKSVASLDPTRLGDCSQWAGEGASSPHQTIADASQVAGWGRRKMLQERKQKPRRAAQRSCIESRRLRCCRSAQQACFYLIVHDRYLGTSSLSVGCWQCKPARFWLLRHVAVGNLFMFPQAEQVSAPRRRTNTVARNGYSVLGCRWQSFARATASERGGNIEPKQHGTVETIMKRVNAGCCCCVLGTADAARRTYTNGRLNALRPKANGNRSGGTAWRC